MVERVTDESMVDALEVADLVRLCDIEPEACELSPPRELSEPAPKRLREMASSPPSMGRLLWAELRGDVGADLDPFRA